MICFRNNALKDKTIDDKMKLLEDTASKMKDYLEENENFNKENTKWNRIVDEMRDNVECEVCLDLQCSDKFSQRTGVDK